MKVLHFIDANARIDNKGSFNYLPSLIKELSKLVVTMVCVPKQVSDMVEIEGFTVQAYSGYCLFAIKDLIRLQHIFREYCPDIVHIHGCSSLKSFYIYKLCVRRNVPVVVSLGKTFLPWHVGNRLVRFISFLMFQRRMLKGSCALHAINMQEKNSLLTLGSCSIQKRNPYNDRIAMIQNHLFTNCKSAKEMAESMFSLYSKVSDSNPYMLMNADELKCEDYLLIDGITPQNFSMQNSDDKERLLANLDEGSLRKILLHANDEGIYNYVVESAIRHRLRLPIMNVAAVERFKSLYFHESDGKEFNNSLNITRIDSDETLTQTERDICRKIVSVWIKYNQNTLQRVDFAELYYALRFSDYKDVMLRHALRRIMFNKRAARILSILGERYGLTEGYMFMPPLKDNGTKRIHKRLRKAGIQ